ncbi:MAG: hypothetical protein B7Y23_02800 [Sulfurovum sp. 16-42-52]|nr:MAG: hypothetical protein B7Y23_02800 [Sulfurovum sp. 16-42-52]OZA46173.1 MAG: hypothetical protein B7X80_03230 [Sulfurovum sp. 17-42-90]
MTNPRYGRKTNKACNDYYCPTVDEIKGYFSKDAYRIHKKDDTIYNLADRILCRLGHCDILDANISIKNLTHFRVEVVMFLTRRMAVYAIVPQRYGHNVRNILAASVNAFSGRIYRFRAGHKLPTKTRRQISKAKLERLISDLCENEYLWLLAERYVESYKWRLSHGYCEAM